jgi:Ca-activated chloride channel family protein
MVLRWKAVAIGLLLGGWLCAHFGVQSLAQVPSHATATLTGTIVDNVGVIPGAKVTATNVATTISTSATTNDQGEFRIVSLIPGRYVVKIEMDGFRPVSITEFTLLGGEIRPLGRITTVAGDITQGVTISAEISPVQTANSALARNITGDTLVSVQVKGRDVYGMASTVTPHGAMAAPPPPPHGYHPASSPFFPGGERYARHEQNGFKQTTTEPLSTFAADVDTASFANVRRFLKNGQLPPQDAVRTEELLNYFRFPYPQPQGEQPVSITTEVGPCPWAPEHQLALVGLRARAIDDRKALPRRITLLLDVSGSMQPSDRLPMIKTAMRMFADTLRANDRLAIVVYAGASGLALPSTPGSDRTRIHHALESLEASGSTNGAAGIRLAYQVAREHFLTGGINRVILATDGDFNVGTTGQSELLQLIETERESGIFLSVLGVGRGNLKDETIEMLADKGNGHYAYLDSLQEARRVLVAEGGATLETVAKDVKFQLEFNPARVAAWKLIGYENRLLAAEDFNDDRKDGGELGAGHTVTVLYEIVPAGRPLPDALRPQDDRPAVDPLLYQTSSRASGKSADLFTVKVRYELPDAATSTLMTKAVREGGAAKAVPFAAAVAEFAQLLRNGDRDRARWQRLSDQVNRLDVVVNPVDQNELATLVAMAAGIEPSWRR